LRTVFENNSLGKDNSIVETAALLTIIKKKWQGCLFKPNGKETTNIVHAHERSGSALSDESFINGMNISSTDTCRLK
jgi:hypothetical protein